MPTYLYEILTDDGEPSGVMFEVVQSMKDDAWERVPDEHTVVEASIDWLHDGVRAPIPGTFERNVGRPCRRVILAPRVIVRAGITKGKRPPAEMKRPLAANESRRHFFRPDEVAQVQKKIGNQFAECIQPDGTVLYKDERQARRFAKELDRVEAGKRAAAQRATERALRKQASGQDPFTVAKRPAPVPEKVKKRKPAYEKFR